MQCVVAIGCVLLLASCLDYNVATKNDPDPAPTDTDTVTTDPPPTDTDSTTPTGDTADPPLTCDGVDFSGWQWWAKAPFQGASNPTDSTGLPYYDHAYDPAGSVPIALPDLGIPVGFDRAYTSEFNLSELPVNMMLELQSDDGIVVHVNGTRAGAWGGGYQEEGCVNEQANCVVTVQVDPVDVTALLVQGRNTIAARVSNPIENSYFEIIPHCVDP